MADRHGKVTRWVTETHYRIDKMTISGKGSESGFDTDGLSLVELEALERQRLHRNNEILVSITIVGRERVLYGMTKEEFRESAHVLTREPALEI